MSKAFRKVKSVVKGIAKGFKSATGTDSFKAHAINIDKSSFNRKLADDAALKASRAKQVALTDLINKRATGEESVAAQQLQAAQDRGVMQRQAAIAGQRGASGALAQRDAARRTALEAQQVRQESGLAAANERNTAQQLLAQQTAQRTATDVGIADSDRASQQALQNLRVQQNTGIQAVGQAAHASKSAARGGLIKSIGSAAAAFSDEDVKDNIKDTSKSKKYKTPKGAKESVKRVSGIADKILKSKKVVKTGKKGSDKDKKEPSKLSKGAAGFAQADDSYLDTVRNARPVIALNTSDEDKKSNIQSGENSVSKHFLDKLKAVTYDYKDPESHGEGHQFGIIAQDLEKTGDVGKQMVMDTPEGKMVDFGKGFGAILASQVELNNRLKSLESSKNKKSKKKKA